MARQVSLFLAFGLVAAVFCTVCGGCQQETFTRQRYETIHMGMQGWQVRSVLGEPGAEESRSWSYRHEMPFYRATIVFDDQGRVTDKSWSYLKPAPPTVP